MAWMVLDFLIGSHVLLDLRKRVDPILLGLCLNLMALIFRRGLGRCVRGRLFDHGLGLRPLELHRLRRLWALELCLIGEADSSDGRLSHSPVARLQVRQAELLWPDYFDLAILMVSIFCLSLTLT